MLSDKNYLNIKYLKLINHIDSKRTDWSHYECEREFDLGWIMNGDNEGLNQQKKIERKKQDAKKAHKGDRILLCQNNYHYGHRATHVVQVIDNPNDVDWENDVWWKRRVQVVWLAKKPWEKEAPFTKEVIGSEFSFCGGNLVSVDAETVKLNLDLLMNLDHLKG